MKKTNIKKGTNVLRWNGTNNEEWIVASIKKDIIELKNDKIPSITIKKDKLKWQKKYLYHEEKWVWNWRAPPVDIKILVEKIEGNWIKTCTRTGKCVSILLTEEAHKRIFWFLRDPHLLMTDYGYNVEEDIANELQNFLSHNKWIDVYYWFTQACTNKKFANEIIKWMMGPLKKAMTEKNIQDLKYGKDLPFHASAFGSLVGKVVDKNITATMGKDILHRMFDGEDFEKIFKDDKYKISSNVEITKFIKNVINAHPKQVEELKSGKDKLLGWLVGQVMQSSRGRANAAEVKEILIKELNL